LLQTAVHVASFVVSLTFTFAALFIKVKKIKNQNFAFRIFTCEILIAIQGHKRHKSGEATNDDSDEIDW
jgi:hypothetical protein